MTMYCLWASFLGLRGLNGLPRPHWNPPRPRYGLVASGKATIQFSNASDNFRGLKLGLRGFEPSFTLVSCYIQLGFMCIQPGLQSSNASARMMENSSPANLGLQPCLRCIQPGIHGFHSGFCIGIFKLEYPELSKQDPHYLKKTLPKVRLQLNTASPQE